MSADNTELLRDDAMSRGGSFVPEQNPFIRDVALWRACTPERSCVQIRAAFLTELVELAMIDIRPGWTIAGEHLLTVPVMPFRFRQSETPDDLARIGELGVAGDQIDAVRQVVRSWPRLRQAGRIGQTSPENTVGQCPWTSHPTGVFMAKGWIENHSIRDYAKLLRIGYAGLRDEVHAALDTADPADPEYPQKENFWRAALYVCQAGIRLGERHAELARHMASETDDPREQDRLTQIAEMCSRVPAHGARSLHEAVHALWFGHVLTCGEDGINANSIGRLDQVLFPYYDADVRAEKLTRAEAVELMKELACKLYLDYDVQAITLGGVDSDGDDSVNELSHIILEATRDVGFVRDVSVRLHRNSPKAFVRLSADLIARGGGIPFIFNDDTFVPAMHDRGIALADARDYAPIGCIELTVPGKANPHAVSGWFNALKCVELALFDGADPRTGEQLGPRTGGFAEFATFDQFMEAYQRQVDVLARNMVYLCNRGELAQQEYGPLPCWSLLTDDCIARGRDITDGGPVYNYHSICLMGVPNAADSLMALKKLVFEQGKVTPERLLCGLRTDFANDEELRQTLLHGAPKYGNDHEAVDLLARDVSGHFIDLMDTMRSPLGGHYVVHLFTFKLNIPFGRAVGATPDGRRAEEPLAYSLSAHQGRDVEGVTAMLNSLARLPHNRAAGASAAIIDLDPDMLKGDSGVERLAALIESAIEMGVGQLQWNVTSVEQLRKAQDDPEHYGNITVRVAGYSQMFKLIERDLQDHIIARTKHRR